MSAAAKGKSRANGDMPTFNETALSSLRAKIEHNLAKQKDKQQPGKRKRQDGPTAKGPELKKRQTESRARGGDAANGRPQQLPKAKPPHKGRSAALLKEIRELGGDEKDMELIGDIESDSDEEVQVTGGTEEEPDQAFKNELAKFASTLGFDAARMEDLEDGPEEEGDAEEEEPEDEKEDGGDAEGGGAEGGGGAEADWADEADGDDDEDDSHLKENLPGEERIQDPRFRGKVAFDPRPDWHAASQGGLPSPKPDEVGQYTAVIASLHRYARDLLEKDVAAYESVVSSSSSRRFMSQIMSSGTMSDKVSALTLAIQESPVHNMKALENLMGLGGKRNRGMALSALGALVDLLGNGVVLPSDRRLRTFGTQPRLVGTLQKTGTLAWRPGQPLPGRLTNSHLIMWVYEDWLKDAYFKVIQSLEVWCGDEIEYSRSRALNFIFNLLKDKPEQEANLLRLLVNKFGDRERKIASRASDLLLQLLNMHPGMKAVVINTIEQELLRRPSQSLRAKYYAMNMLNQTILSSRQPDIADNLLRIYFEMFVVLLKSGTLESIDGPLSDPKVTKDQEKPNGRGPRVKEKEEPKVETENDVAEKLVSAILTGVNRTIPFAAPDDSTLEKHVDTLFKITHASNFNTSIQALMLIQQLSASKHHSQDRFYRTLYESLLDPRLITSSKQAQYLNLLYRSLKNDVDVRRVKAFVKRMLQIIYLHQPAFTCGILYLVASLEPTFPDLKTLLNEPEDNDANEEEVYKDVVEADDDDDNTGAANAASAPAPKPRSNTYDGRKRDPEHSNAQRSCLWELIPYFAHYHPSVNVFGANIMVRQKSLPKPELANHTLLHFLDRFVYRNPRSSEAKHGSSIMQPVATTNNRESIVVPANAAGAKPESSVNSAAFWNLRPEAVAAEDAFFHAYFSQVGKKEQKGRAAKRATKGSAAGDGEGNDEDDEAEDEIWDALVKSRPEIDGQDEGFSDMEGFDDDDDDEDDDDLAELLEMSSDNDDEDDGGDVGGDDEDLDMEDAGSQASDGGVELVGFDDSELSDHGDEKPAKSKGGAMAQSTKERRQRKRELKALPTFASADDYAAMLGGDEDDGM